MTQKTYKLNSPQDNLIIARFEGENLWSIPDMLPFVQSIEDIQIVGFRDKWEPEKGVHCFTDDYRMNAAWLQPEKTMRKVKESGIPFITSPDFSCWADDPVALQIYNIYKSRWVGRYWQENGINVIPSVTWSTPSSYAFSFAGLPHNSTLAVSSVGCLVNAKEAFLQGLEAMNEYLKPKDVLFHGKIPPEAFEALAGARIHQHQSFYEMKWGNK